MQTHLRYYRHASMMVHIPDIPEQLIGSVPLDIKIGFADSPRELVIPTETSQDEVVDQVTAALEGEAGILELSDEKGRKFLINVERITYVEVGVTAQRSVGFAGV